MNWWLLGGAGALALLCWWAWGMVPEEPLVSDFVRSAPPVDSDFECPTTKADRE